MSTIAAAPRPFFRAWFPLLVLLLAPAVAAAVWYWPGDWEYSNRFVALVAVGAGALLLLAVWLLLLSGLSWWLRVVPVVLAVAAAVGLRLVIRDVRFSGDMWPTFVFIWDPTADERLEADRRGEPQGEAEEPPPSPRPQGHPPGDVQAEAKEPPRKDENLPWWDATWYFPDFRGLLGNERNGVVTDTKLDADWKAVPPEKLWRRPVGGGYAGFATLLNRAVTIEQRRDKEAVVCYDVKTGKQEWVHSYPAFFQEKTGGNGPRATPTVVGVGGGWRYIYDAYRVYSLGGTGTLRCLDLKTGKKVWEADVLKDNANLTWGMAGSPLFLSRSFESRPDLLVVAPGVQQDSAKGRAVIAFDPKTGKEVWASGNHRGSYSSPMVSYFNGGMQLLVLDGDGLTCYDPEGGKELWHYEWKTFPPQYINAGQPLVLGKDNDRVFISSGYDKGCAMLRVKEEGGRWSVEPLWENKLMRCKFTTPVHRDGYIYGLDEGILTCLSAETGERKWKGGRYGHGQVLLVDKHLLILSESGQLVLVEATPDGHHELAKFAAIEGKTWNPPALSECFVFVRNDQEMACYKLPGRPDKPISDLPQD
jgi:outer membrane protein assembly factor BamB